MKIYVVCTHTCLVAAIWFNSKHV